MSDVGANGVWLSVQSMHCECVSDIGMRGGCIGSVCMRACKRARVCACGGSVGGGEGEG